VGQGCEGRKWTLFYIALCAVSGDCFSVLLYMQLKNVGGLSPLAQLLKSVHPEIRRNACWAISVCANDELTALDLCNAG